MTAQEIAATLLALPDLTEEALEPLGAYRAAKRQTGAPCDLESLLDRAARDVMRRRDDLREYLGKAAKEAAAHAEITTKWMPTWFALDARNSVEAMTVRMRDAREHFNALAHLFGTLGDRIVATPEEQTAYAAKQAPAAKKRAR